MSYPLGHNFVKSYSVYICIYFEWSNFNYKKNKRLIILMLKSTCVMRNSHFVLLLNQQPSQNAKITLLEKYEKFLQSRFFLSKALQIPPWNIRSFLSLGLESSISWNIKKFFQGGFFLIFFELRKLLPEI